MIPTRAEALILLQQHTQSPSLLGHAYAVEAAMRAYARRLGEDEELWGVVGLLHDIDYEKWPSPEDHPYKGAEILRAARVDEIIVTGCLAHGKDCDVERDTPMRRAIFAVDELTGLITAVALVRESKKLAEVELRSIKKKLKTKAFAAAINREDIALGAEEMGVSLDEHIAVVLEAMQGVAGELGL